MAKYNSEPSPDRLPSDQPAENSSGYGSDLSARPSAGVVESARQRTQRRSAKCSPTMICSRP